MALNVKEASNVIERFIRSSGYYAGITFDKYSDRSYVSYVSDELVGDYKRAFGGDYESSISIGYSALGVGFTIEVYFSSARARMIGHKVPMLVNAALADYGYNSFSRCEFTRFIPGETALTFTLLTNPNSIYELSDHLEKLSAFVKRLSNQI